MKTLSQKKKIKKIRKRLDVDKSIKIVESCDVRVWTNYEKIFITSAAIDQLDIDEIAFAIAHEDAHISSKHEEQKAKIIDSFEDEVKKIMGTDKGVGKKMLELMGLGVVGVATLTTARHIHEIEADVKAKLKLKKSGFDEKSGEKFLKKIDDSISLSHPSSTLRSEVLKLFK